MMQVCQANAEQIAAGKPAEGMDPITHPDALALSTESLSRDYPLFATSLLNLVTNAEKRVLAMPPPTINKASALSLPRPAGEFFFLRRFLQPAGHGLVPLWAPFGRPPCGTRKELRAARLLVLSDHYGCPPIFPFLG